MVYELLYRLVRNILPGHVLAHRYPYMFTPAQLVLLVSLLDEAATKNPDCAVLEVGCAAGNTTVFLAYHLREISKTGWKGSYHAYDTFSGFAPDDIAFEVGERKLGLPASHLSGFRLNDQRWVQNNLDRNRARIAPVTLHRENASTHDFAEIGRIAFVLLDVDLYRPTENTLTRLWPKMAPGGIIVLDDCRLDAKRGEPVLDTKFGGGHDALLRFAATEALDIQYAADKLAVLRKA